MIDRYLYICNKCGEEWWFDPDDGRCPICRKGYVIPKSIYFKNKKR